MQENDKQPKGIILSQERYDELLEKEKRCLTDAELGVLDERARKANDVIRNNTIFFELPRFFDFTTREYQADYDTMRLHGKPDEIVKKVSEYFDNMKSHIKSVTKVVEKEVYPWKLKDEAHLNIVIDSLNKRIKIVKRLSLVKSWLILILCIALMILLSN